VANLPPKAWFRFRGSRVPNLVHHTA
jgi:hypothetical protein